MWEDTHYCWVVLCKNFWCQIRQSAFYKHRIPLAETDIYSQAPQIKTKLKVRCYLCQREYFYGPTEVMRYEQELPANFSPHALFVAAVAPLAAVALQSRAQQAMRERRRSSRSELNVEVLVWGESADKRVFQERAYTVSVNAHGALLALPSQMAVGQTLQLKKLGNQAEITGRVAQSMATPGGAHMGVEFLEPDGDHPRLGRALSLRARDRADCALDGAARVRRAVPQEPVQCQSR